MGSISDQLVSQIETAYANQTPINIHGAGSKSFLGYPAPEEATSIDLTPHHGIVEYDPAELVLVARAGTPLHEVERVLAANQQMLGFEPPYIPSGATLGGAVAAGLAGPRRPYAGGVRDFILGIKFINGQGHIIESGGKVMKNVAGFDLFRPMAGSMGTLGVILEVSLRVIPQPERETTLVIEEADEVTAIRKMNHWIGKTQLISASCWDGKQIQVRLSGSTAGIEHAWSHIGGELNSEPPYWEQLNNFELDFYQTKKPLWRISVAPMSKPLGKNLDQLIDWGGAQRWIKTSASADTIRSRAERLGGHAVCYQDDTRIPTFHPLKPTLLAANQRFKKALDPAGILNPGRIHPEL